MRLLLVTNTYPPGDISGVGALVSELAAEAERQGHAVRVLTRAAHRGADDAVLGVPGPKLLFPLTCALSFLRWFRAEPPDVIHVHESDGALVALAVRAARTLRRPLGDAKVVATLQVSYAEERRSVRPVRAGGDVVSLPTGAERVFAWLRAPILSLLGRWTSRLADAVVAPSRATARELERDYGCQVDRVIPNGVFPLASPSGARREETILYVGRLRTRKAVAVLLEAFAKITARRSGVILDLVGSGEQEPALRRATAALGLGDRVRFRGALPRRAVAELYHSAGIFCLPSIYEGFPVAILEAMSAGLPVVATDVAGIPEAVENGVTGYVVPPENVDALARRLQELLENEALRGGMGEAGRRRFENAFSIERVTADHFDLYRQLASAQERSTQ